MDNRGHVRIYDYFWFCMGAGWADIDGEGAGDSSGFSVSISSDGKRVAIGAEDNDIYDNRGHVRIYDLMVLHGCKLEEILMENR